jgi:HrpA-like RNA helicase
MNHMTKPEIQRTPLSNVTMQMMAANIKDILKFEFLDQPPPDSLRAALKELRLLKIATQSGTTHELTDFGKKISRFPLEPRLSKALMASAQHKCSEEAIIIASFLSGENVFTTPNNKVYYDSL